MIMDNHTNNANSASDFSGYCQEITAWRVMADITDGLLADAQYDKVVVSPKAIAINDDGSFRLVDQKPDEVFEAPETRRGKKNEASLVWSLAATIFHLVMGCDIMNGKGGAGQHAKSKVPYMRSEMPLMSALLQRCLHFDPTERPSLSEVSQTAHQQYEACSNFLKKGPAFKQVIDSTGKSGSRIDEVWPEEMIDNTK